MKKQLKVIKCFDAIEKYNVSCNRNKCKKWISAPECRNCLLVATKNGPQALQKINNIFDLTRIKTTQMVESVFTKIREMC